jgi:hypothetical protein
VLLACRLARLPAHATQTACVFAASHYDWFKDMQAEDVKAVADEIVGRLTQKMFALFPKLKANVVRVSASGAVVVAARGGRERGSRVDACRSSSSSPRPWRTSSI